MNATSFFPPAGANTPLVRFSSLPSRVLCHEKGRHKRAEGDSMLPLCIIKVDDVILS
jgi:hypothetical protein